VIVLEVALENTKVAAVELSWMGWRMTVEEVSVAETWSHNARASADAQGQCSQEPMYDK